MNIENQAGSLNPNFNQGNYNQPAQTQSQTQSQQNRNNQVIQESNTKSDPKALVQSFYEQTNPLDIPKEIFELAPNLKIFEKLLQCEKEVDKLLSKKRIDIQEQLARPFAKSKRVLRMHIFNNHSNQNNSLNSESPPYWTLRIQAKLLGNTLGAFPRKFSYFVKQIQVKFNHEDYPNYDDVIWKRSPSHQAELDGFEIKRVGNKETNLNIMIQLFSFPPKFKVDPRLSELIGIVSGTRIQVYSALWEYIKLNKLQDKENRNIINNDIYLKQLFNCEKMMIDTLSLKLKDFLHQSESINLTHHVRLSGDTKNNETIHDIEVDLDSFPVNYDVMPFFVQKMSSEDKGNQGNIKSDQNLVVLNQKIKKLDKKCTDYIEKLKRHKQKKDAYEAYEKNPSIFIENLIYQQNGYLAIMNEDDIDEMDDPKKLNFLLENEDLIEREIRRYLAEKDE